MSTVQRTARHPMMNAGGAHSGRASGRSLELAGGNEDSTVPTPLRVLAPFSHVRVGPGSLSSQADASPIPPFPSRSAGSVPPPTPLAVRPLPFRQRVISWTVVDRRLLWMLGWLVLLVLVTAGIMLLRRFKSRAPTHLGLPLTKDTSASIYMRSFLGVHGVFISDAHLAKLLQTQASKEALRWIPGLPKTSLFPSEGTTLVRRDATSHPLLIKRGRPHALSVCYDESHARTVHRSSEWRHLALC
jgi:hypothetical protein